MRRRSRALALSLGLGLVLGAGIGAVDAAAPTPSYVIQLTDDGACHFTAAASWAHAKVDEVVVTWSFGLLSTWQDDLTGLKGRHAAAAFTGGATDSPRTWSVSADFYLGGTLVGTSTDDDVVACALQL